MHQVHFARYYCWYTHEATDQGDNRHCRGMRGNDLLHDCRRDRAHADHWHAQRGPAIRAEFRYNGVRLNRKLYILTRSTV